MYEDMKDLGIKGITSAYHYQLEYLVEDTNADM